MDEGAVSSASSVDSLRGIAICRMCSWLRQQCPRQQNIVIDDLGMTCNDLMAKSQSREEF